jgi:hypothetical protein
VSVSRQNIRRLASALAIGTTAALVFDAVLRNALAAAQSPGVSSLTPWWDVGRVLERSVWIVVAILIWLSAGTMAGAAARLWAAGHLVTRSAALDVVGRLMIALPLFWVFATWIVLAARITVAGSWDLDGQMFASTSYYNNVLLGYLPWAAGGVILIALSRHASE